MNTFHIFRRDVLKQEIDQPSDAQTVERYISSIITETKPTSSHIPAPNVRTIVRALLVVVDYGRWKFDFKQTTQDRMRMKTLLDNAVRTKQLLKGRTYERKWAGLADISRLIRAYIERGSFQGARNWDRVVVRCLALTLLAANGARVGDIMLSRGYKRERLRWRDIAIYWEDGEDTEYSNLKCRVTLHHTKGHKNEANSSVSSLSSPLRGDHLLHLDYINWLFTLALRSGNVHGTTTLEVLEHSSEQQDLQVQWVHPNRPVIPAFARHDTRLFTMRVDKPSGAGAMQKAMVQMADAAGVTGRLAPHDVRRGFARGLSRLSRKQKIDVQDVGEVLGHGTKSTVNGVTRLYIEADDRPHFEERAYLDPELGTERSAMLASSVAEIKVRLHLVNDHSPNEGADTSRRPTRMIEFNDCSLLS